MASTDLVTVRKVITQTVPGVGSTTTIGTEEDQTVGNILAGSPATLTAQGTVLKGAFVAAAAVPFADLTAAANSFNALRTSLINAGVIAAS